MAHYKYRAKKRGRYDSKLESRWHHRLSFYFLDVSYIGDVCNFADFKVGEVYVEIKPHGMQFVTQAHERANRYMKSIVIIEGKDQYSARWWVSTQSGILAEIPGPKFRESIEQYLLRNGLVFI